MRNLFLVLLLLLSGIVGKADLLLDAGFNYSTDSLTSTTSSTNSRYFYNANILLNIDKKKQWNTGWVILGISQNSTAASITTNYSSFDMGPGLRWNIDKDNIFSVTAAYGYLAKGTYSEGSTSETWEGTSLFGQLAIQVPVRDQKFFAGLSLNYYAANYSTKIVGSLNSSLSTQKTWIFPMITLTWRP